MRLRFLRAPTRDLFAMRQPYGAEVVGRRARLLRSDGRWHGVVVTGFDRSSGTHELRFVADDDARGHGAATAAYDLNHPARHVRWVGDDGTSLLPTDVHPCLRRVGDGGGGGGGATTTTPLSASPPHSAPLGGSDHPPAARRRPGGAGPAPAPMPTLTPARPVTATHLSIGSEKFALSAVVAVDSGGGASAPGAAPPAGVVAASDVVLLSSVGGCTRFLFTAALAPARESLAPASGPGCAARGANDALPQAPPPASDAATPATTNTSVGARQRRVLTVVDDCLSEVSPSVDTCTATAASSDAGEGDTAAAPAAPPQQPPQQQPPQLSLRLLPVVLPPAPNGRAPALPLPPPPGGWAAAQASPDARLDPHRLMYRRVAVHWPREGTWFTGRVTRYE
jgi:hypothetical protein